MSIIVPTMNRDDIEFNLSPNFADDLKNFTKDTIMNCIANFPAPQLNISKIHIVDEGTADSIVKKLFPNQSLLKNSLGKCLGLGTDDTITNYIFYRETLFINLFDLHNSGKSIIDSHDYYVLNHELGHCQDHNLRGEIIAPPYKGIIIYEKIIPDNYYSFMFKGELGACFNSAHAITLDIYDSQMFTVSHWFNFYKKYFLEHLKRTNLKSDKTLIENFYFTVADICWAGIATGFSKVLGFRFGNPQYAVIDYNCPDDLPEDVFYELVRLEQRLIPIFNYPNFDDAIMAELLTTVDRLATLHGCTFTNSGSRDIVLIDGFNR